ncbi:uncharacterized protein LOC141607972 [Silene latifolia]|uniref:uncharacterized protein LOC141607972 n=1 Tax=Silene latifolia TaxID=37657 RepID=UPI003D78A980
MDRIGLWNMRGINGPDKQKDVRWFLQQNKLGLCGLVETKVMSDAEAKVHYNLGTIWNKVTNNNHYNGGRVWIIWISHIFDVTVIESDTQLIHVEVIDIAAAEKFWFTVVYGFNEEEDRVSLWNHLIDIKKRVTRPWCICGDFNCVLDYHERIGRHVNWRELIDFRNYVDQCEVEDIQAKGALFTWNNKQEPQTRIFSRIDRFMVNMDWMNLYHESYAHFLPEGLFDHTPCVCFRRPDNFRKKPSF